MKSYYKTPESWDRSNYSYVVDMDDIKNTVANTDWYEDVTSATTDCEYLGDFESRTEAESYAKEIGSK